MTCSSCPWSARTWPRSRPCTMSSSIVSPISRRSKWLSSARISVTLSMRGCRVCCREKARSCRTRLAARLAFCLICMMSAKDWSPGRWRSRSRSENPIMAVNRLLKSWAMPPASCPTACIFCDWANWTSSAFCSVVSSRWQTKPAGLPAPSITLTERVQSSSRVPCRRRSADWPGPLALATRVSRRSERSSSTTQRPSGSPTTFRPSRPSRASKAGLHSRRRPPRSSSTMAIGASSKKRLKRRSESASASAAARSRVKCRTTDRVRSAPGSSSSAVTACTIRASNTSPAAPRSLTSI